MLRNLFIISVMFFSFFQVKSQDVTMSLDTLVALKSDLYKSKQKIDSLENLIIVKQSVEKTQNKKIDELKSRFDSLQSVYNRDVIRKDEYDSLIQQKDNTIKELSNENIKLQESSDLCIAKLANGRLFFKYDEELVHTSIEGLRNLKSEKIKKNFGQALMLLENYENFLIDVRNTILDIQAIDEDERNSKHRSDEYKKHCLSILKNSEYYQNIYSKRSNDNWSVPYLDNVIDITKSIISKHNPIDYKPANFVPVIEMLR